MTPTNRDAVTDNLYEPVIKEQPPLIGTEPHKYVKNGKIDNNFLKQWTEPASCMGFIKPTKPDIGITMLMGAESGNIIIYTISNSTGQYIQFELTTLTKTVNTDFPMQKN